MLWKLRSARSVPSFHVASIGFNVPFDSPEAMRTFARQQGVMVPGWEFLSPDLPTLERPGA